jgi:queuosine precursor transporter
VMSIFLASPRIAIASGAAFLTAQLLDVSIFDRLRAAKWWKAPLVSSTMGSVIDTILFFGIAFAATFAFLDTGLGREDASLGFGVPLLSVGPEVPLWVSLALGDFIVKMIVALALLAPYKVLRAMIPDRSATMA